MLFLFCNKLANTSTIEAEVYIASLDASNAFDRVNTFKLFSIYIKKARVHQYFD